MLDGLTSWMKAQKVTEVLTPRKDREIWRGMIANAMEEGTDDEQLDTAKSDCNRPEGTAFSLRIGNGGRATVLTVGNVVEPGKVICIQ